MQDFTTRLRDPITKKFISADREPLPTIDEILARAMPIPFSGCYIWEGSVGNGYADIRRRGQYYRVSRLVLSMKLGRPLFETECACHTCDIPACVNPGHLFIGSRSENILDSISKGRWGDHSQKGEKHWNAKLTEVQVHEIVCLLRKGVKGRYIARQFAVSDQVISFIKTKRTWRNIPRDAGAGVPSKDSS